MDLIPLPPGPSPYLNRQAPPIHIDIDEELVLPIPLSFYKEPRTALEATPAVAFRVPDVKSTMSAPPLVYKEARDQDHDDDVQDDLDKPTEAEQKAGTVEIVAEPQLKDLRKGLAAFVPTSLTRKRKAPARESTSSSAVSITATGKVEDTTTISSKSLDSTESILSKKAITAAPEVSNAPKTEVKRAKIEINLFSNNPLLNVLKKPATLTKKAVTEELDKEYEDFKNELKDLL